MPDLAALRPGDPATVGQYGLTGRLGEGGQGIVYLATGPGGTKAALKLLRADLAGDAEASERFVREVAMARRVAPFCTAQVIETGLYGGRPYIVSEYIDGPTLTDVVRGQGPRSGAALHRLAIGTVTALVAIHQAGIVHRDFKPSNVVLAPDGPRVIDFGIAKALDLTSTLTGAAVGTPAYMAPEQFTEVGPGAEADMFAWACTLLFAASGQPPFGYDSVAAVVNRILHTEADTSCLTDPALRALVTDCLAKDPAGRPTASEALMRLLGQTPATPPPGDTRAQASAASPGGPPTSAAPPGDAHAQAAPASAQPPTLLQQGTAAALSSWDVRHAYPQQPVPPHPTASPTQTSHPQYQQSQSPHPHTQPSQAGFQQPHPGFQPPHQGFPQTQPSQPSHPGLPPNRREGRRGSGWLVAGGAAGALVLVAAGTLIAIRLSGSPSGVASPPPTTATSSATASPTRTPAARPITLPGTSVTIEERDGDPIRLASYTLENGRRLYVRKQNSRAFTRENRYFEYAPNPVANLALATDVDYSDDLFATVSLIDRAGGARRVVKLSPKPVYPTTPRWSPDGRYGLVTLYKGTDGSAVEHGFGIIDATTGEGSAFEIKDRGAGEWRFFWDAGGKAVGTWSGGAMRFYDLNGKLVRTLPGVGSPVWVEGDDVSPSGSRFLAHCTAQGTTLCARSTSGHDTGAVTIPVATNRLIGWWDDERLAVWRAKGAGYEAVVIDLTGKVERVLAKAPDRAELDRMGLRFSRVP
ncbi:protein kinase [Nonomuraea sp. NPDC050404]|uniref:protein kinase domain-containing protein n=1 Tax=Nonomuraea sp. NPDC050404 TaxID=3155783 RepID=UPI0033CDD273